MKFGEKLLELRKKKGISQEELGDRINVTRQTISNWELGETTPNTEQLKLLSKEFNISIDELLDNDIKNLLVEKVSNTEKLAGLILKILKYVIVFVIVAFILMIVGAFLFKYIRNNEVTGREMEDTIYCKIYGEEHFHTIVYEELTDRPIVESGDSYFDDILNLSQYNYAHQIFNIINDYVKKNGGTCEMLRDRDLTDIVDVSIKEGTLTKEGATIIIKEKEDYDITYGEYFWLEKYDSKTNNFDIIQINNDNNCAYNMIGYIASPDSSLELNQNWSCEYGSLSKGRYKLVKNVNFQSDIPIEKTDMFYIWVEFEIE